MSKNKKSILKSIVCWLLAVLLVLGLVAAVVFLIKDFAGDGDIIGDIIGDTSVKKVSVIYNGTALNDGDNVELPESGKARFEVANGGNYSVKVLPNVTDETDFNYYVDGVPRSFAAETGFTDYFVNSAGKAEKYFEMSCSYERFTLEGLLSYYNGSDVTFETDIEYPFKLVVTSSAGSTVTVNLKQNNSDKSIKFDTDGDIVF